MLTHMQPQHELNDYQQLMYNISKLTPYNAVHAVKLKPCLKSLNNLHLNLETAINHVLHDLEIGEPCFSKNKKVQFKPLNNLVPLEQRYCSLLEHAHREINRAFLAHELPLRFFFLLTQDQNYLSITYDHWITDAFGIHQLITAILSYAHGDKPLNLSLSSPKMKTCYPSTFGFKASYYRMKGFFQTIYRFSSAYRTPIHPIDEIETGIKSHIFEPKVLELMKDYCKTENISLNDFFIAILAQLFGKLKQADRDKCQRKLFKPKRDQIVIGVISNIRPHSHLPLNHIFSLFLGFFYLSFKSPEHKTFQALSQSIHAQTYHIKKHYGAVKQTLLIKLQNRFWNLKKNHQGKARLFSKNIPLTLGISNMNMDTNPSLIQSQLEHYIRFSPTAIVCPIIFNLTSLNRHLSLAISFRKQCYTEENVELILSEFVMAIYTVISKPKSS